MSATYLWQQTSWPHFRWDITPLLPHLGKIKYLQGELSGRLAALGFDGMEQQMEAIADEVLCSSEIEGITLQADSVRSSVARRLGLETATEAEPNHYVEGIVNVMMQATQHYTEPLNEERLFDWHSAMFPLGRSEGNRITVAAWRTGEEPTQVVSGPMGKERVHFEAPPSSAVPQMMTDFIAWVNAPDDTDPLLRAALAHLWFVTIHPFDDGNGRMTRTITEMMLARADGMPQRFYSMSKEIMLKKRDYYSQLEQVQHGDMDVTAWILWFLQILQNAIAHAVTTTDRAIQKTLFWQKNQNVAINERQRKIINRLWDGIEGVMNSSKWAKMTHTSQATALRDIEDLISKGILRKNESGGRSTNYMLSED